MSMRVTGSLLLWICFALSGPNYLSSFAPPSSSRPRIKRSFSFAVDRRSIVARLAQKAKTKRRGGSGSGGGFGGGGIAARDGAPKTRAISGHTKGSGTKPLREAANTFDALVKQSPGNNDAVADVYVRSPRNNPELMWFVGKVARCVDENELRGGAGSTPTFRDAVLSQKRVILEYASRELRPQNLGGPYAKDLELWTAPGNSEMDCVQNRVTLHRVEGSAADIPADFSVKNVGYNPEIYVGDEIKEGGLRISRDEHGAPVKPEFEINQ